VAVSDVGALRAGQVREDVTSGLLLAVLELVQLALVRRLELRVERSFLPREGDRGDGRGGGSSGGDGLNCDVYSVRRVWSGRRRCENKRR
jgi:hypothetical protein